MLADSIKPATKAEIAKLSRADITHELEYAYGMLSELSTAVILETDVSRKFEIKYKLDKCLNPLIDTLEKAQKCW